MAWSAGDRGQSQRGLSQLLCLGRQARSQVCNLGCELPTLAVLAPYAPRDKQALLEAKDLKARADVLIALTEMQLARQGSGSTSGLQ